MNWLLQQILDFLPRRSDIAVLTNHLNQLEKRLMAKLEQFVEQLNSIDTSTNAIADELRALREDIKGQGLSSEFEDQILARLSGAATRLNAIASPEPDPAA